MVSCGIFQNSWRIYLSEFWLEKTDFFDYLAPHESGYQIIQIFIQFQSLFFKAIGQNPSDEETQQLIMRVHSAKKFVCHRIYVFIKVC